MNNGEFLVPYKNISEQILSARVTTTRSLFVCSISSIFESQMESHGNFIVFFFPAAFASILIWKRIVYITLKSFEQKTNDQTLECQSPRGNELSDA